MTRSFLNVFGFAVVLVLVLAACTTASDDDGDDDVDDGAQIESTEPAEAGDDDQNEVTATSEPEGSGEAEATSEPEATATATSETQDATDETETTPTAGAEPDATTEDGDDSADDSAGDSAEQSGSGQPESIDGTATFIAHDAGEVDIQVDGDNLTLVEVRANDGWEFEVDDEGDDDIEVGFRQSGREVDFDAEIDDGRLEVDIDSDWDDTDAGTFQVGDAGEVEFERDGDNLNLIEVRPNEGWDHSVDDEDDEEIEVDFRRDSQEVSFDAEVDDGQLDVGIDVDLEYEIGQ